MEPFTWAVALKLLLDHGPLAVSWAVRMSDHIRAGRGNETVETKDVIELERLDRATAEDILLAHRGIVLPPLPPPASTTPNPPSP